MTKLAPRGLSAAATSLVLSIAFAAALVLPASGLAAPPLEGSDPVLTISPQPVVLPTTTVGNQSQTVEFELHNESGEEAWVEKTMLEGENAGEFSFGSNCGPLQPGQHCSVWIALKPSNVGAMKTKLHVYFAGGRPEQSFEVSGESVPPHFAIHPGNYNFGLVPIHSEGRRMTFQLENDGQAGAQVGGPNFSGGNSNGFWFNNNDCGGRWLAPGETCPIEIGFSPNDPGPYAIQLQVSSGSENFTASLSGEGGRPIVEASPNPLDFGAATVGSASSVQTVTLSNSGNVPTAFFIGVIAGGDAGSFELLDENCSAAPLMPAGSCSAHVRFTPLGAGTKVARLAFFGEGEGGMMVALTGEGVDPVVTLAPSSYDFGAQDAGSKSAGHAFAIRNEGSTPLDLDEVAIVGADLDQFALAGDECSGETFAPGAECLVRVRFAPDSAGAKAATLRVRGDAGAFTAPLSGNGIGEAAGPGGQPGSAGTKAGTAMSASLPASAPRPQRARNRHRRFARGDSLPGSKHPRPRRLGARTSVAPR